MAPRKNRPVLYEVVSRGRRSRKRTPVPPSEPVVTPAESTSHIQEELANEDERLYLALGGPQIAIAAVILLVVTFAAYKIGQRSAQPEPEGPSELEQALVDKATDANEEAARPVLVPDHRGADGNVAVAPRPASGTRSTRRQPINVPAPTAESPEPAALESGYYYALVQYFPRAKRSDANAARDFLRSKGIKCIVRRGQGDWQLIASEKFSSAAAARNLLDRIRVLGREYNRTGGYDFAGCQARKL